MASTVASRCANTPSTPGVGGGGRMPLVTAQREDHRPMFTKIEITNSATMLVRTLLTHNSQGRIPLQMFMVQLAHQNGPNARYQNAARSCGLPLNQATKFSVTYE